MRMFLAVAAAVLVVAVAAAGCGAGGTTTVVHKTETQAATPKASTDTTTSSDSLMDTVIQKDPAVVHTTCHGRQVLGDSKAKVVFVKGYGATKGGVSGAEFYDYVVANYC